MASSDFLEELDEGFFQCSICLEQLKDPKLLPCGHRYCLECLRDVARGGNDAIKCPECREEHVLPASGVDGLRADFFVKSMIEFVELKKPTEEDPPPERDNHSQEVTLYIQNLHDDIDEERLRREFASFGNITSAKVIKNNKGVSRGFGYVYFSSQDEATQAMAEMNGHVLSTKPLKVSVAQPKEERDNRFRGVNLYIRNLDDDIDDERLSTEFARFGNITSVKVMKNDKGVSRGYGFVCFSSKDEATKAVTEMNGHVISTKPLYVAPFQPKEQVNRSQGWKLYIRNLEDDIDNERLRKEFARLGNITSANVVKNAGGVSRGYGFVCFSSQEEATKAVNDMNGRVISTKPLYVAFDNRKEERDNRSQGVKLYIRNLEDDIDDERLKKEFARFGNITSANVVMNAEGVSRGFGFVYFSSQEEATKAMKEMNGHVISTKPLHVAFDKRKEERDNRFQGGKLYIRNLEDDIDDERLKEEFARFGNITSVNVVKNAEGVSRGFGFVCFSSQEEATKAWTEMNGHVISTKPLYVAFDNRKEERDNRSQGVKLYIRNLEDDIDDERLKDEFARFGNITSVNVVKNAEGVSRGFGFVGFSSQEEATKAVTEMNGHVISTKPLHVAFDNRKEERDNRSQGVKLYIRNLEDDIDDERLKDEFARFGNITSVNVVKNAEGVSRGFGFVCFSSQEEATKAVTEMNGHVISTKPLHVAFDNRKEERDNRSQGVKLYIRNLEDDIDDERLKDEFARFGNITSVNVVKNAEGVSRGFGFVCFSSQEEATKAVTEMNGHVISTKPLHVAFDNRKEERDNRSQGVKLYIRNLEDDIDDERLKDEFARFGNITSVNVVKNAEGVSRGFGFVCFSSQEEATKAVTEMNGHVISTKPLHVAFDNRKEERDNRSQGAKLYIRNLEDEIDDERLKREFARFGNITSVNVVKNAEGVSRGFGFVCFSSQEEATKAAKEMNRHVISTKPLHVVFDNRKEERDNRSQGAKLYIRNLEDDIDDERLKEEFARFGNITSVNVVKNAEGVSRGFGFVCFSSQEEATKAVNEMNRHVISTKPLHVAFDNRKLEERDNRSQGGKLYIRNLEDDIDDESLKREFARFGNITSAIVVKNAEGVSRGFGFVCFTSREEATEAVNEMNGHVISTKPLYVAFDNRKEVRRT